MKWIILIGNDNLSLSKLQQVKHSGSKKAYFVDPERLVVEFDSGHIFYDYAANIIDDYEKGELDSIPYKDPNFIMMVYRSETLLKAILKQSNYLSDIYIDNDNGTILPIKVFIEQIDKLI